MYESHWHLQRKPFEHTFADPFYYPSESHQGALLKLRYSIENRRGAALLAGGSGVGKTLLIQQLLQRLPDSYQPRVHIVFPQMPPEQLLRYVAVEAGCPCPGPHGEVVDVIRQLRQTLADNTRAGRHGVIVIDEAQVMSAPAGLETLRLLLNLQTDDRPDLTLVLAGQLPLLSSVERLRGLEDRISVKCVLRALHLEETISYVNHRLTAAGAHESMFESGALERIHQLTGGIPRRVNRLCDLCLLIGYADGRTAISADQVENVCEELITVSPE